MPGNNVDKFAVADVGQLGETRDGCRVAEPVGKVKRDRLDAECPDWQAHSAADRDRATAREVSPRAAASHACDIMSWGPNTATCRPFRTCASPGTK
nr:hypothetical protein GCM10017611_51440 [Rhodococcus wratislaviensis]